MTKTLTIALSPSPAQSSIAETEKTSPSSTSPILSLKVNSSAVAALIPSSIPSTKPPTPQSAKTMSSSETTQTSAWNILVSYGRLFLTRDFY